MHLRASLLLPPLAPVGVVALMTLLGNVTACSSGNAATMGAMGGSAAGGSSSISGASGSGVTIGGSGGGTNPSGSVAGGGYGGGVGAPMICDSTLEAEDLAHSTGEAVEQGWNI